MTHFGKFMFWLIICITVWIILFGGKVEIRLENPIVQIKELYNVLFRK